MEEFARQYGEAAEDDEEAVSRVVDDLDDEEIDDELREAELRLSKAAYYKVIAKNGVIEDDGSREAQEVNAEARLWARQSMVRLLKGAAPEAAAPIAQLPFTEKQLAALIAVANKILAQQGEKPADPAVRTISATPAPAVPTVRTIQTKPVKMPPPKKSGPKTPPAAPAAASARPPRKEEPAPGKKEKVIRAKRGPNGEVDYDAIPTDVLFKDVDGQLYKFVSHPNEDNTRIKRKVSGQVRAPGLPMPSPQAMEGISATQSMDALNTGVSASATSPFGQDNTGTRDHFVAAAAGSINKE